MTTDQTIHFLLWLVIASAWCVGSHTLAVKLLIEEAFATTSEQFWDSLSRKQKLIHKPLWACPACMASVHGTVMYFAYTAPHTGYNLILWITFCVCLCGLNYFVSQFFVE